MKAFLLTAILFITTTSASFSQASPTYAKWKFGRFDVNKSGWLSGNELTNCECKQYDTNADNEVTLQEFFIGLKVRGQAPTATSTKPAPATKAKPVTPAPVQEKTVGRGTTNIIGAWSYTAFIEKNGSITRMGTRVSSLNFGGNGKYEVNTWLGGSNNMRQVGTYTLTGNRLTMISSGGDVTKYTLSFAADGEMSMRNEKGGGYLAAR